MSVGLTLPKSPAGLSSVPSAALSAIERELIPFVRGGGTAIVPVRDEVRCKLLRLREEDVLPREKIGYACDSLSLYNVIS